MFTSPDVNGVTSPSAATVAIAWSELCHVPWTTRVVPSDIVAVNVSRCGLLSRTKSSAESVTLVTVAFDGVGVGPEGEPPPPLQADR